MQLVVSINVHELPSFVLLHLRHVREHLHGIAHRIILNCNDEMLAALRRTEAAECCHPDPLSKRRHHGSLLQGIVRNMELAMRRWDVDAFLVLSSRSWFRRPLTAEDLDLSDGSRPPLPPGAPASDLRYARERGMHWVVMQPESAIVRFDADGGAQLLRGGPASEYAAGVEQLLGERATEVGVLLVHGPDGTRTVESDILSVYRDTLLARELAAAGHTMLHAPHEGLLLSGAACEHALRALAGKVGADLYRTEAAVEEFALQSAVHAAGLSFAQLSDMGRPGDGHGMGATGQHLPPLTKTVRFEAPEHVDGEQQLF